MAIFQSTGIFGYLCSALKTGKQDKDGRPIYVENFLSGFAGWGWRLWQTVAGFFRLEIDELVVRRTMVVFELLIQKIRAIVGAQAITQGNGKIKGVELSEDGTIYLLTLEDDEISIVEHDFIRCQVFSGGQRFYHVEVASVEGGFIHVPSSEFEGSSLPMPGDEVVQFGNSSHDAKYAGRHSAIYMHTDESGQPAIDVMFDIYEKDWTNCVKVRVGGDIPGTNGLKGFYCENGMIKCVATDGHTTYCLHPDGTAELGDGAALFRPDKSGHIAGGAISWLWSAEKNSFICTMTDIALTWDNLDQDVKDQITGVGVDLVDVEYAQGDSSSVAPATGWQTTAPAWVNGEYIWSRTKITYSNGTTSYTKAACISGGRGIKTIEEQYYLSSSSSTQTGGSWGTASPAWKDKWYIWTRSMTIYTDGSTMTTDPICVSGGKGDTGNPGHDGTNGADGVNGDDGVSLVYKGEFSSHPANPQNGWYYRNTADRKSYVYHGAWYVMTIDGSNGINGTDGNNGLDGINGKDGNDGLSVVWKGNSTTPPANPQKNWCYRDTDNGLVYIYNGTAWALMVADGTNGTDGTNGSNGLSVFITYHDSDASPVTPTGNGTAGGWHTDATAAVVWMSQKVAVNASSGEWGTPVRIKAKDGENGTDANLLPWVKDWNDKVYVDPKGEYFISPKIFSGKNTGTKEEPILTGIAMGHDCLTESDGTKRTGIFALVDNEKVFELDPINEKYLFKGRVEADEGVFNGSISTPFLWNTDIDFNIGCNYAYIGLSPRSVNLPSVFPYIGTSCRIYDSYSNAAYVTITGNIFARSNKCNAVKLHPGCIAQFISVDVMTIDGDKEVAWLLENASEFNIGESNTLVSKTNLDSQNT